MGKKSTFQFLIGKVKITAEKKLSGIQAKFQFLIGKVKILQKKEWNLKS